MTDTPNDRLVTVFGGSGFLGRYAVRALAQRGFRIRVAVRRPDLAYDLQPLGRVGQIHAVQANVRFPESVMLAAEGADTVVNLVGILSPSRAQTFEAVQAEGAGAIADAAKKNGAQLIHVSAIGADPKSPSAYARTKAAGEKAALAAGAIVFRPSIVFGPEDDFFNRFASLARFLPALPLIGGGHTLFQPVFVGDVGAAILAATEGQAQPRTIYELGGPEVKTFRELMELMLREIGRKRLLLTLPFGLASLQATFLEMLPGKLLTRDQVMLLKSDNVVSAKAAREGRTLQDLGITPTSMAAVLEGYLWRFRKAGQFTRLAV
ncbi:MAG TPA: complex I NDUFA9 subunit family protein [Xanthobacteraceae bacterium]|nr:complex I NDUFA9 subunit family protein [Xanthobacteraceae bacterium]